MIDLKTALPLLLPGAITWAEARAEEVATNGIALTESTTDIARFVGVLRPELIRVAIMDRLLLPEEPMLKAAALQMGLLGPGMIGLTFGYSVLIRRGHETRRLLFHEFRHVHQYESLGGIVAFLPVYLQQIIAFGYPNAPFEKDAEFYANNWKEYKRHSEVYQGRTKYN